MEKSAQVQKDEKLHQTIWLWILFGIDIWKPGQKRFLGVYIPLRELQCTKAAGAKKSIALLKFFIKTKIFIGFVYSDSWISYRLIGYIVFAYKS